MITENSFTLATDLDGTFIPLTKAGQQLTDLERLRTAFARAGHTLIFATGRGWHGVQEAVHREGLPLPDWLVGDVGVSVYQIQKGQGALVQEYQDFLMDATRGSLPAEIEPHIADLGFLRAQPAESQSLFKHSYFCPPEFLKKAQERCEEVIQERGLPFSCVTCVDPAGDEGLIDILPCVASKYDALIWLADFAGFAPEEIVFAGDSGNDRSALVSDMKAILVGNATPSLRDDLLVTQKSKIAEGKLYFAQGFATSGVLEGCRHFGMRI